MSLYPEWWRTKFLLMEFLSALCLSCVLFAWTIWFNGGVVLDRIVHQNRGQIYGTLASIAGTLLGFVLTSLSIVLGLSGSDKLQIIKTSSHYKDLWAVFTSAIRALALTTCLWLVCLFLDRENQSRPLLLAASFSASILGVFRLARCVWVLERIVEVMIS